MYKEGVEKKNVGIESISQRCLNNKIQCKEFN